MKNISHHVILENYIAFGVLKVKQYFSDASVDCTSVLQRYVCSSTSQAAMYMLNQLTANYICIFLFNNDYIYSCNFLL